jgi:hypothetical protein
MLNKYGTFQRITNICKADFHENGASEMIKK